MSILLANFVKLQSLILQSGEHSHEHEESASWFQEYLALLQDPAHILFEVTISIVFDLFIVYLGYQLFIKRIIIPKLRRDIHKEIDEEHHADEPDCTLENPRGA